MSGKVVDSWPSGDQHLPVRPHSEVSLTGSSSASQVFTKWLKRRQQRTISSDSGAGSPAGDANTVVQPAGVTAIRGQLFPARLALALGMAKTLLGLLLVAFGALALWEQAAMAYLGSGNLYIGSASYHIPPNVVICACTLYRVQLDHYGRITRWHSYQHLAHRVFFLNTVGKIHAGITSFSSR